MSKNDLTFGALLLTVMATLVAAVVVEVRAVPAANANASLAQVVRQR